MIKENVVEFSTTVDKWIEKTKGKLDEFVAEFCGDISQQVIEATPVKTGFLRGSWWSSKGDGGSAPGTPGNTVGSVSIVAAGVKVGDRYHMQNGAAYAARIEYGFVGKDSLGRTYNQAPRSFVRSTIDRAEEIATAAAERVAKS